MSNMAYAHSLPTKPSLTHLWFYSFCVFMIIHIFDLIVLDYLIVIKWHPKFLNLPDTDYYKTFKPHLIGFFKGIPLGVIASLISSLLYF
jgi:hypothetical protein